MIGSPEKVEIQRSSIPKIRKIHSCVWKLQVKNSLNCQQSMIFSKRTIRTTSIPKIRKIRRSIWKIKAKKLQTCKFWPKNGQILVTGGQILAISEFSRHIHYDFLKEDHKGSVHTKNYECLQRCLDRPKILKNIRPLTFFGHFGGQKIFRPVI